MKRFPFLTQRQTLILLRYSVALVFMAHALVRVINDTIPQFSLFFENKGFIYAKAIVWAITVFEIVGSIALAAGYFTKWLSAGFILMLLIGIVLIHASLGWFVGEHGTGGCEYSFILIMCLLLIASDDKNAKAAN
ncbi:DoxX family protein [Ferruginibacter sp.]|nr:DoxX family protein [Ferruginibacter sp.]